MPDLIARDNAGLLKNDAAPKDNQQVNGFVDRLRLEADLIGGGLKDGFMDRFNQAKANPGLTALEIGGAAAIGAGLTAMHAAGGRWAFAANVAGTGLKYLAIADVARRTVPSVYAGIDTMINPQNFAENKDIIARYMGGALFDYPVMMAAGAAGSAAAYYGPKAFSSLRGGSGDLSRLNAPLEPPAGLKNLNDAVKLSPAEVAAKIGDLRNASIQGRSLPANLEVSGFKGPVDPAGIKTPTEMIKSGVPMNEVTRANFGDAAAAGNNKFNWGKTGEFPNNIKFDLPKIDYSALKIQAITTSRLTVLPIIPLPTVETEKVFLRRIEKK